MNVTVSAEGFANRRRLRVQGRERVEHDGRYRLVARYDAQTVELAICDEDPMVLPAPKVVCVAGGVRVVRRVAGESREDEYVIERMTGTDAMGAPRWELELPLPSDAPYRAALVEMAKRLEEAGRGEA